MTYTIKQFMPLITFVVPSIIISIILFVLLPTEWYMIVGFAVLVIMASFSYYMGIKGVLKEQDTETK
jgi:membrane protein implicated in regulation of membrane protease activity